MCLPLKIRCESFEIGSHPDYSALSYTWGHPVIEDYSDTGTLKIHHPFPYHRVPGKLTVTPTLHDALLQLQRSGHSGYLWIDAICIDQSNTEERNHQVNIMCGIYENASCGLIWIGKEDESAPVVIGLLHRLAACARNASPDFRRDVEFPQSLGIPTIINHSRVLESFGIPDFNDDEDLEMSIFLNQRWFRRVWIIQEVALAQRADVPWGSFTTSWKTLSDSINHRERVNELRLLGRTLGRSARSTESGPIAHSYITRVLSDFASGGDISDFLSLPLETRLLDLGEQSSTSAMFMMILRVGRLFRSKEPQDKAFGLLGVIQEAARVRNLLGCPIKADYDKSLVQSTRLQRRQWLTNPPGLHNRAGHDYVYVRSYAR